MLRNEGGSLGIAIATTLVARRAQFHQSRLAEQVRSSRQVVSQTVEQLARQRMLRGGVSPVDAHDQGFALLTGMVTRQARELAYLDVFWVFWVMALLALPLVLLMKKSVARGGPAVH
jgi:DHA2 family multidrug resistance protein